MAQYTFPNENRQFIQANRGEGVGNMFASYGIDLNTERGRMRVSEQSLKLLDQNDNASFDSYAAAILEYDDELFAIAGNEISTPDADDPTGTWTYGSSISPGNTVTDAVVFDGLLLVVDGTDIEAFNGTTWSSWWQGTLGESALTAGQRFFLDVGPDGNLYIVDAGTKVYRVTPAGSVTKTGQGTLDFSDRPFVITAMESNSSRLWIGYEHTGGGQGGVIEWDLGPQSISPNRIHKVGAKAVRCIAIWNDVVIAVLSSGAIKYFNGTGFVKWEGAQFAYNHTNTELNEDFIHPNGWAIIDDMPHFLASGRIEPATSANVYQESTNAFWYVPAGVWCLDSEVGLYHRYAVGAGTSTQSDYGQPTISQVGALYSAQDQNTKFLASYQYYEDGTVGATTEIATLVYHDVSNSKAARAFAVTQPYLEYDGVWDEVRALHKELTSGEQMNIYYRHSKKDTVILDGVWNDTTSFHTTESITGVATNDLAWVKSGQGAGQFLIVDSIDSSSSVNIVNFKSPNSLATLNDGATIEVLDFKRLGTITNQTKDWHEFRVPGNEKKRKMQLLLEFQQAASNNMELDFVIINT